MSDTAVAMSDTAVALTAEQLSHLRHDLRTPIGQITGYGEMAVEDAEAEGSEELAAVVRTAIAAANAVMIRQNALLLSESSEATLQHLAEMRDELVPQCRALAETIQELYVLSQEPEHAWLEGTVSRMCRAAGHLLALTETCVEWSTGAAEQPASVTDAAGVAAVPDEPAVAASAADVADVEVAAESLPEGVAEVEVPAEVAAPPEQGQLLLLVDDNEDNREMLGQRLEREGYRVETAYDGAEALRKLGVRSYDLMLLDILMPEMDGYDVLRHVKSTPAWREMPVIMISALDEIESVVRCIEMGAEDYLPKPFNPVLLRARIGVALERKRLRDEEREQKQALQRTLDQLAQQKAVAEAMLLNVLPERVARELEQHGEVAPMYFEDCTIGFTDFVGFSKATERLAAEEIVSELHKYFTVFDQIITQYSLEKLKTIGDSYMFVSGLPDRRACNPVNAVLAALEMVEAVKRLGNPALGVDWQIRIGLHTGPVIAGVVGIRKFAFDIWGDSVNFASRMESCSEPNRVNISERTYARVKDFITCEHRGRLTTKDNRDVDMYFANGIQERLLSDTTSWPPPKFVRRFRLYFQEDPQSFPSYLNRGLAVGA